MKKIKTSDYAKFITLYYDHYVGQIKKFGEVVTFNGKTYKSIFSLKYDTILQIKYEFNKNELENDLSLSEMFKIVFWQKDLKVPYDLCYNFQK